MFIAAQRQLAILLPALLAATLAFACTSADEPARTPGFHAEVAVEVEPSPDDPLARFGVAEGRSVIRWWYVPDPVRWRWEIETVGSIIDDGVALTVVNETDSWEYDDRSNTYRRGSIAAIPDGVILPPDLQRTGRPGQRRDHRRAHRAVARAWRPAGGRPCRRGHAARPSHADRRNPTTRRRRRPRVRRPGAHVHHALGRRWRRRRPVLQLRGHGARLRHGNRRQPVHLRPASRRPRSRSPVCPVMQQLQRPDRRSVLPRPSPASSDPRTRRPATTPPRRVPRAARTVAAARSPSGPCSKAPTAATSFSVSASVPAVFPGRRAPGNPSTPASRRPTATPKAASSASSGATATSSPSSRAPPCPSESFSASPSPPSLVPPAP